MSTKKKKPAAKGKVPAGGKGKRGAPAKVKPAKARKPRVVSNATQAEKDAFAQELAAAGEDRAARKAVIDAAKKKFGVGKRALLYWVAPRPASQ